MCAARRAVAEARDTAIIAVTAAGLVIVEAVKVEAVLVILLLFLLLMLMLLLMLLMLLLLLMLQGADFGAARRRVPGYNCGVGRLLEIKMRRSGPTAQVAVNHLGVNIRPHVMVGVDFKSAMLRLLRMRRGFACRLVVAVVLVIKNCRMADIVVIASVLLLLMMMVVKTITCDGWRHRRRCRGGDVGGGGCGGGGGGGGGGSDADSRIGVLGMSHFLINRCGRCKRWRAAGRFFLAGVLGLQQAQGVVARKSLVTPGVALGLARQRVVTVGYKAVHLHLALERVVFLGEEVAGQDLRLEQVDVYDNVGAGLVPADGVAEAWVVDQIPHDDGMFRHVWGEQVG